MKRNILDVSPQLAGHFIDIDDPAITDLNIVELGESKIGKYHQYLGLLHDSWVLKATVTPGNFSLILNDFTTHVFADALLAKKGFEIEDDELVFRVDIKFETVALTFNTVDDDGFITEIKPVNIDEYLYEEIISATDEIIEIGLIMWEKGNGKKRGRHILILITAKKIFFTEHQDEDWAKVFGNKYDLYYDRFKAELAKGEYLSDQSRCEKLITQIDGAIG